jgi:predicted DNA-binding WGR domain protein
MSKSIAGKTQIGVYELYRYRHPNGEAKEWAVAIVDGQVNVRYGKAGSLVNGGKPEARFTDAHAEKNRRVREKTRKGYEYVDRVVIHTDGSWVSTEDLGSEDGQAPQPQASPDEEATVFFEIRVRNAGMFPEFLRACREACDRLAAAGVAVTRKLNEELAFRFAIGDWPFGVGERVELGYRNTVSRATRQGAGNVRAADGVYPLLFLLYLKRYSPAEVALAWKDGIEITEQLRHEHDVLAMFGTDLDAIRPVAVALGLAEERIDLAALGGDESLYF